MTKVVDVKQQKWVAFLPFVTAAYNSSSHYSTTLSPNFLMFGRELNSAVDIAFGCPRPAACSTSDYAFHTRELMAEAYAILREHLGRCADVMKSRYDASVKPTVSSGRPSLVLLPEDEAGTSPKWTRFYTGPYRVVRKINDVNYVIQSTARSRQIVVHINKLKPYSEFSMV